VKKLKKQTNFYARKGEVKSVIFTNKPIILLVYKEVGPFGPFNSDLVETFKINALNASFNAFVLDRVIGPFGTCNGSLLVFMGWSTSLYIAWRFSDGVLCSN
jgi:hypothetical protein